MSASAEPDFLHGTYTSESVTEGHPDKVADFIADSLLDALLDQDPAGRLACEVLCKHNRVVLAGEWRARPGTTVDRVEVVREALRHIGYMDARDSFSADTVRISHSLLRSQSRQIAKAVDSAADAADQLGAGDQGVMYGYATSESPTLMPIPIALAHLISAALAHERKTGAPAWLKPDAKTQVSVRYDSGRPVEVERVLVSTQHAETAELSVVRRYLEEAVIPSALGSWWNSEVVVAVNPAGEWTVGGPAADAGVTGRKIMVDTYGGVGRHGGGAFSGKDPTKVDRSAAYFCRYVARQIVLAGVCERVEVRVAYAIGVAQPFAVGVETFGTGSLAEATAFLRQFDFRPGAIIERLDLQRPIYRRTTNYGHFGRPGLPWEQ